MLGRVIGFILGFGLTIVGSLALNGLYRGVWMPMALVGVVAICFSRHPRLAKAPGSSWFIAFFGLVAIAIWMRAIGPSPVRVFQSIAYSIPTILLLMAAMTLVVFLRRNAAAESKEFLYLPVVFLLAFVGWGVVFFSGSKGGADPMVGFFMDRFGMDAEQAKQWILVLRKTVHFSAYGLIGLTAYRLANPRFDLRQAAIFGVLIALSFAAFDEFHQSTTTNRSASPWDVGLDMLGAITFIGLSVLRYRHRMQPPKVAERLPS